MNTKLIKMNFIILAQNTTESKEYAWITQIPNYPILNIPTDRQHCLALTFIFTILARKHLPNIVKDVQPADLFMFNF